MREVRKYASGSEEHFMRCTGMENKLVEYLDGRAKPAERHAVEEHLSACAECRVRAEEFRMLWSALDDLPGAFAVPCV